jgi:hypothetical protein
MMYFLRPGAGEKGDTLDSDGTAAGQLLGEPQWQPSSCPFAHHTRSLVKDIYNLNASAKHQSNPIFAAFAKPLFRICTSWTNDDLDCSTPTSFCTTQILFLRVWAGFVLRSSSWVTHLRPTASYALFTSKIVLFMLKLVYKTPTKKLWGWKSRA